MKNVLVIVGSLRKGSINRKFARTLEKLAEGKLAFHYADLNAVPIYNEDLWENTPEGVSALKTAVDEADAVLLVTPEYNRSTTPAMLNAVSWASRPYGKNSWQDKVVAIVGATPGATGTTVAQSDLRSVIVSLGAIVCGRPEIYFQMKDGLITDDYEITSDDTKKFLTGWVDTFAAFIDRHEV